MLIEAALVKPLVDVLMGLFRQGETLRLKHDAEAALREAIRELLMADPNDGKAEARIAVAKAAGILSEDVVLAEDMLKKHRATKARTRGKSSTGRKRTSVQPDSGAAMASTASMPAKSPPQATTPAATKTLRKRATKSVSKPKT